MRVKIIAASTSKWYRNYIGKVFDVEERAVSYVLLNTPHNENIIKQEPQKDRIEELLRRLRRSTGLRLGLRGDDCQEFRVIHNNREAAQLLSKEW